MICDYVLKTSSKKKLGKFLKELTVAFILLLAVIHRFAETTDHFDMLPHSVDFR